MDYFVVRIYRRQRNDPRVLVGVVEGMQEREKKAFTSYEELWDILNKGTRRRSSGNLHTEGKK